MNTRISTPTGFAAPLARVVLDHVGTQGLDVAAIRDVLGLTPEQLNDPSQRVPSSRLAVALELASRLSADPNLPIHASQLIRPAHLGTLGYALVSSPSVTDALSLFERMQRLLCNEMRTDLSLGEQSIQMDSEWLSPMPRDTLLWTFVISARLSFCRWVMGRELVPLSIDMPCPAPAHPQAMAGLLAHLGCAVRFDAERLREVFPMDWLTLRNPNSDPALHRMMASMTDQLWSTHQEAADEITVHLRQLITLSLNRGQAPSIEALLPEMARAGCTSVRQLQRRLAEQALSFKELVEQVRREQVLNDLRHTDLPLTVVAERAAYAEPASFHRAVKRWTGTTPLAFRAQHKPRRPDSSSNRS